MARATTKPQTMAFDRIAATVIVGLAVFLLIRNQPVADARLFLVLRVVVSFSAAVMGATIPGFLELSWRGQGLAIRAGGALALFVLTFIYTPDLVDEGKPGSQIRQESKGPLSPNIVGNKGSVEIRGGDAEKQQR